MAYQMKCHVCKSEWISEEKEFQCLTCAERRDRTSQYARVERARAFVSRERRAGRTLTDREEVCEGCGEALRGNSYIEHDVDTGAKNRVCESCDMAVEVYDPPMLYQKLERDWQSKV